MPRSVSIEHWESDPHRNDDRCDLCGSLARVVRVSREPNDEAPSSPSIRLCPKCLRSQSTHRDLLDRVKQQYPDLWKKEEEEGRVCGVCGGPAEVIVLGEVEVVVVVGISTRSKVRSLPSRSFCQRCAPR